MGQNASTNGRDASQESIDTVKHLQLAIMQKSKSEHLRGQHPKQHGCVRAEFEVLADIPDRLKVGYFVRWFFWSGVTHAALDAEREGGGTTRRLRRYHAAEAARAAGHAALSAMGGGWSHAVAALTRLAFSSGYVWSYNRSPTDGGAPGRRQPEAA